MHYDMTFKKCVRIPGNGKVMYANYVCKNTNETEYSKHIHFTFCC